MALTRAMLLSSLFGYISLGCAIAAFAPLLITNAVQRRSGTGLWFLLAWLVADILNVIAIVQLAPQLTQVYLAAWYGIANLIMLLQLAFFGHSEWPAPAPKPTTHFLAKQARARRHPWWNRFCLQFMSFSIWDDVKLLVSTLLAMIAWWGLYLLWSVSADPDFEIKHKTDIPEQSYVLGMTAAAIFAAARIPEAIAGWRRSLRGDKPEHEVDSPLFYFFIGENVFNIISIVTLSQDPHYLWHVELPWLLDSIIPILFDTFLILSTLHWHRRWLDSPKRKVLEKEEKRREKVLEGLERKERELREEWEAEDLRREADRGVEEGEEKEGKDEEEERRGLIGRYKKRKEKSAAAARRKVRDDYLDHFSQMEAYHDRAKQRAGAADVPSSDNDHLPRPKRVSPSSPLSPQDSDNSDAREASTTAAALRWGGSKRSTGMERRREEGR